MQKKAKFHKERIHQLGVAAVGDGILMVATISKAEGWQTLPALLMVEFIVLMGLGWVVMTNVLHGVVLPN